MGSRRWQSLVRSFGGLNTLAFAKSGRLVHTSNFVMLTDAAQRYRSTLAAMYHENLCGKLGVTLACRSESHVRAADVLSGGEVDWA